MVIALLSHRPQSVSASARRRRFDVSGPRHHAGTRRAAFPAQVGAFLAVMKSDNPMVERSGFLIGDSAAFAVQVEKMIREAQNPMRRTFSSRSCFQPALEATTLSLSCVLRTAASHLRRSLCLQTSH